VSLRIEIAVADAVVATPTLWVTHGKEAPDEPQAWVLDHSVTLLLPSVAFVVEGVSLAVGKAGGPYWARAGILFACLGVDQRLGAAGRDQAIGLIWLLPSAGSGGFYRWRQSVVECADTARVPSVRFKALNDPPDRLGKSHWRVAGAKTGSVRAGGRPRSAVDRPLGAWPAICVAARSDRSGDYVRPPERRNGSA
jgi:hypothetical protein